MSLKTPQIILASASPRREHLLRKMDVRFIVVAPIGIEELRVGNSPEVVVIENARRKAAAVADIHPEAFVIGADTEVALDNRIFGKPRDLEDAVAMLETLAGKQHEVLTAVCLMHRPFDTEISFCERSQVWMRSLTSRQIREYFTKVNPLDKAGGYAIQEHGTGIVERISGSFDNVMGLPTERLRVTLLRLGMTPDSG